MTAHFGVSSSPPPDTGLGEGGFTRRLLALREAGFSRAGTANPRSLPTADAAEATLCN